MSDASATLSVPLAKLRPPWSRPGSVSVWAVLVGRGEIQGTPLSQQLEELEDCSPNLRAASTSMSLGRLPDALEWTPETTELGDPVELQLVDLFVLARLTLQRQH